LVITIITKPDWLLKNTELYQPLITVLIPCHNEESVISETLSCLLDADYPSDKLEIIVIDDLSSDNTLKIIQDYEKKCSQIHVFQRSKDKMRGKAAALNEALIKFTKGEIIYFLDADHRIKPDTIVRLVRHFLDPKVGAVNGRSIPWNRYNSLISSYVYLESLVHNRVTMYASGRLGFAAGISGSNFCVRRELLEKAGLFHEKCLTEDMDLAVTICKLGYSIKYDITSITEHEAPNSIESYMLQHLRWNRGFNEVARSRWREILFNRKLPLFSRINEFIFSLGYLDRLFFCIALVLTFLSLMGSTSYQFPYWVWLFFICPPTMEILIGLFLEKAPFTMYLRLPLILSMFSIDIFMAVRALLQDIVQKPTQWYKTPRVGDRHISF